MRRRSSSVSKEWPRLGGVVMDGDVAWPEAGNTTQRVRVAAAKGLPYFAGAALFVVDGGLTGWQWLLLPFGGFLSVTLLTILLIVVQSFVGWVGQVPMAGVAWPLSPGSVASVLAVMVGVVIGGYFAEAKTERIVRCVSEMVPYGEAEQVERVARLCARR